MSVRVISIGNANTANSFALGTSDSPVNSGDGVFYDNGNEGTVVSGATGFTNATFAGFVARQAFNENIAGGGHTNTVGETLAVLQVGTIIVKPASALSMSDSVFLVITSTDATIPVGSLVNNGTITNVASVDISGFVKVLKGTSAAGEKAKVQILTK